MKAAALLAIISVALYWKLTFSREFTFLDAPDLAYQVLPWYQFQAEAWHSGTFPLWDPYQWCGQPLIGQLQPGATFPLNWPLFLAPLKDGRLNLDWFHWHFVLMHWLAALFMYAYCRELERSRAASLIAGCGFVRRLRRNRRLAADDEWRHLDPADLPVLSSLDSGRAGPAGCRQRRRMRGLPGACSACRAPPGPGLRRSGPGGRLSVRRTPAPACDHGRFCGAGGGVRVSPCLGVQLARVSLGKFTLPAPDE